MFVAIALLCDSLFRILLIRTHGFSAAGTESCGHREPYIRFILALAIAVIALSIGMTTWPLKARFLVSATALERLAESSQNAPPIGLKIADPWVGLFRIRRVIRESNGRWVFLELGKDSIGEATGLLYCPTCEDGGNQLGADWWVTNFD